jgi:hypothetical protein
MNERISTQPVPYEPLYRHNICHLQQKKIFTEIVKYLNIRWKFPNCVETRDAKYIRFHCPRNSGSQYFDCKQCHSIVLQEVVDADLKFVTVDVGAYCNQSDGGVFRNSALYQSLETRSLKMPEDTVLRYREITLPHIFCWWRSVSSNNLHNETVQQKNIRLK